jgi:hypothetical protein
VQKSLKPQIPNLREASNSNLQASKRPPILSLLLPKVEALRLGV